MRHSASSKLRPVLIAVGIIIVIAFVAIGLIIRQAQARYQSTIYTGNSSTKIDTTKPLSILLLGVDTGADGRVLIREILTPLWSLRSIRRPRKRSLPAFHAIH